MQLLKDDGFEVLGFDSEAAMVDEAAKKGLQVWRNSILEPRAAPFARHDAVTALGPLPHLTDVQQGQALMNLRRWVASEGRVYVELRNELFSLFTFNRHTADLLGKLLDDVPASIYSDLCTRHLDISQPPAPAPGSYGTVFSRFNNPLELEPLFSSAGLKITHTMYYHFHAWPPMYVTPENEAEFRRLSRAMEWDRAGELNRRGILQASALIVEAQRI